MIRPDWQERVAEFNRRYEEERERQWFTPQFLERMRRQDAPLPPARAVDKPTVSEAPAREYVFDIVRGQDGKAASITARLKP